MLQDGVASLPEVGHLIIFGRLKVTYHKFATILLCQQWEGPRWHDLESGPQTQGKVSAPAEGKGRGWSHDPLLFLCGYAILSDARLVLGPLWAMDPPSPVPSLSACLCSRPTFQGGCNEDSEGVMMV